MRLHGMWFMVLMTALVGTQARAVDVESSETDQERLQRMGNKCHVGEFTRDAETRVTAPDGAGVRDLACVEWWKLVVKEKHRAAGTGMMVDVDKTDPGKITLVPRPPVPGIDVDPNRYELIDEDNKRFYFIYCGEDNKGPCSIGELQ